MTGVDYSKYFNPEVGKDLGLDLIALWSFVVGAPYPLSNRHLKLSRGKRYLWTVYYYVGHVLTLLLMVSNVGGLITGYQDVKVLVTCTSTMSYIMSYGMTVRMFMKKAKLQRLVGFLYKISSSLENNPLGDNTFPQIYQNHFKKILFMQGGKGVFFLSGVFLLYVAEAYFGATEEIEEKRFLPVSGWYPYNQYELNAFFATIIFQFFACLSFLIKEVPLELFCLTILTIIKTYLIYLKYLLEIMMNDTIESKNELFNARMKKQFFRWWVTQHQMILRSIEDVKEITNPYFTARFTCIILVLFLFGVLVVTEADHNFLQQVTALALNSLNLLQLYIFCHLGDNITEYGLTLTEYGLQWDFIFNKNLLASSYRIIAIRCSKPNILYFGKINSLSVACFVRILKVTFSYILTTVQIRGKSIEKNGDSVLLYNSTVN